MILFGRIYSCNIRDGYKYMHSPFHNGLCFYINYNVETEEILFFLDKMLIRFKENIRAFTMNNNINPRGKTVYTW